MSDRGRPAEELHQLALVAGLALCLLFILLAPIVDLALESGRRRAAARPDSAPGRPALAAPGAAGSAAGPTASATSAAGPEALAAPAAAELQVPGRPLPAADEADLSLLRREEDYGLQLAVPAGWRHARLRRQNGPSAAPALDLVFEDGATGARLTVSIWEAGDGWSFSSWVGAAAVGMAPVQGHLPTNALVAGHEALVAWSPENASTPAQYAAFLAHGGQYVRIAYSAADGGAAMAAFVRALVTLGWGPEDTVDVVPPLPIAGGRYFPNSRLFDRP